NTTYSASADDIAIQSCFFDIQLTNLSPRNCIPPEVLLRESMHPAWSASGSRSLFLDAYAMNIRTASKRATGVNDSSKSIPSS
ncbi:hypothetical protein Tco_0107833, partial [Tanacetum coccineum]